MVELGRRSGSTEGMENFLGDFPRNQTEYREGGRESKGIGRRKGGAPVL